MPIKLLFLLLLLIPSISFSQSFNKVITSFNIGNYTEASISLYEGMKKDPDNPASQFLMAKIYFTRDNPGYNTDSANKYILKSTKGLKKTWKEKDLKKLQATGWTTLTVNELQQQINKVAYHTADSVNTSEAWNYFISTYMTSPLLKEATEKGKTAAFNEALHKNDSSSFEEFSKNHPGTEQAIDAKDLFEKYLYETKTADHTWQSYKTFMDNYPESTYQARATGNYERLLFLDKTRDNQAESYYHFTQDYPDNPFTYQAEDSMYEIATRDGQLNSYKNFIASYPGNNNVSNAWQQIYEMETPGYSSQTLRQFKEVYPNYPNMPQVDKEIRLSTRQFEKFRKNGLYGFVDLQTRDTMIAARFTEAAPFSEGMSVVKLPCGKENCPYAYVNMDGKMVDNCPWGDASDFYEGHALAALGNCKKDSCKYGFINRFGKWMVLPLYDDAYEFSEGLALVHDNHLGYGYINPQGKVVISLHYTAAGTFSEGLADVQHGDSALYGFIDKAGDTVIVPSFGIAGGFREGLAPVTDENNLWGYVDHAGEWVIKPQYEFALPFINGKASVIVKTRDLKNSGLQVMKAKLIDKKGKFINE
jgi:hypothetical protein